MGEGIGRKGSFLGININRKSRDSRETVGYAGEKREIMHSCDSSRYVTWKGRRKKGKKRIWLSFSFPFPFFSFPPLVQGSERESQTRYILSRLLICRSARNLISLPFASSSLFHAHRQMRHAVTKDM